MHRTLGTFFLAALLGTASPAVAFTDPVAALQTMTFEGCTVKRLRNKKPTAEVRCSTKEQADAAREKAPAGLDWFNIDTAGRVLQAERKTI